jgi:hypothetical protein
MNGRGSMKPVRTTRSSTAQLLRVAAALVAFHPRAVRAFHEGP